MITIKKYLLHPDLCIIQSGKNLLRTFEKEQQLWWYWSFQFLMLGVNTVGHSCAKFFVYIKKHDVKAEHFVWRT